MDNKQEQEGLAKVHELLTFMSSRPLSKHFRLEISRYNAVGGDMWHIWLKSDRAQGAHGATSLNLLEAADKVLKEVSK